MPFPAILAIAVSSLLIFRVFLSGLWLLSSPCQPAEELTSPNNWPTPGCSTMCPLRQPRQLSSPGRPILPIRRPSLSNFQGTPPWIALKHGPKHEDTDRIQIGESSAWLIVSSRDKSGKRGTYQYLSRTNPASSARILCAGRV
ncbi:hypothetical protein C8F04DRAFT_61357 [Mycena alexandri]|uniref:Uncharacterized protein n=1 Tax=Mycena alexandri TaxID=1745969 RepID=A0AAD6SI82_9AGAR|nr:hypothetical protein C8F04DRAFT_61357 [Mycena alexandri]